MVFYIDSIFLINLIMSFTITFLTGRVINYKHNKSFKIWRYFLGSFISTSIYILLFVIDIFRNNFNFGYTLVILGINTYISFNPKNKRDFFIYFIGLHLIAFFLGGLCFGIFYYTKIGALLGNSITASLNNISIKLLLSSVGTSYIVVKLLGEYIDKQRIKKQVILGVKIYSKNLIEVPMLLDTGNTLYEPLSKLPVIIVYYKYLEKVIDKKLYDLYETESDILANIYNMENVFSEKLRIIPYKSIGNENGLILGVECSIEFIFEGRLFQKQCVVGISDFELNKSNEYVGIFNPALIEEEFKNVKKSFA